MRKESVGHGHNQDENEPRKSSVVNLMNMASIQVQFKGQTKDIVLPHGVDTPWTDFQDVLSTEFHVANDAQRVFANKKRIEVDEVDASVTLRDLGWDENSLASMRVMLMAGASRGQIEGMKKTQEAVEAEQRIRATRRVVSVGQRNRQYEAREAVSTDYRFHDIKVLEQFPDSHRARDILEQLANDRGVLAVMAKHKWSVGCLEEMYPDGKVGVDPVCVLGLNTNKGQKISLRLRTDDLLGFRKFLSIKKVLYHELSHNVHSEHDSKFYQLMRQVERECDELDWSHGAGRSVGGGSGIAVIPDRDEDSSASGNRLGGGSTVSRLLREDNSTHTPLEEPRVTPVASTPSPTESIESSLEQSRQTQQSQPTPVEDVVEPMDTTESTQGTTEATQEATTPEPMEDIPPEQVVSETVDHSATDETSRAPVAPLFDVAIDGYEPSERELRLRSALERLRVNYTPEVVTNSASFLLKVVSNIVLNPEDPKYRSIRKANRVFETRIACFPEALEFLQAIGFDDQQDHFVLVRQDPALLWLGRSFLEVVIEAAASK